MTDKELIKALKICASDTEPCNDCPVYDCCFVGCTCRTEIVRLAADRLEALANQLHYAQAERDVVTKQMIALEIERAGT